MLSRNNFKQLSRDAYGAENPKGYVNLGTGINALCEDILGERLLQGDLWDHQPSWQHYHGLGGTPDLLRTTSAFLQERLAQVTLLPSYVPRAGLWTRGGCGW